MIEPLQHRRLTQDRNSTKRRHSTVDAAPPRMRISPPPAAPSIPDPAITGSITFHETLDASGRAFRRAAPWPIAAGVATPPPRRPARAPPPRGAPKKEAAPGGGLGAQTKGARHARAPPNKPERPRRERPRKAEAPSPHEQPAPPAPPQRRAPCPPSAKKNSMRPHKPKSRTPFTSRHRPAA